MRESLLDTPEDCGWLRDTHVKPFNLRLVDLPAWKSAAVVGNEDCPQQIRLYRDKSPHYKAQPIAVLDLDEGGEGYNFSSRFDHNLKEIV